MFKCCAVLCALAALSLLAGCRSPQRDPREVVFLIESSPTSLDPRIGTDAQSEHIDELIFDGLVRRDSSFHFKPALAESWEQPDPRTLIFHLRHGVRFHDGRLLTARDVQWTLDSMRSSKAPGGVITAKANAYAAIDSVEARDANTVILHLKRADNFLLVNLSTGAMGIVPVGSGRDFWQHPIGTGAFRFVSQQIDQNVIVERNSQNWSGTPRIERVRFSVVPDAITMALELQKGSADVTVNSLPMDVLPSLAGRPNLQVEQVNGTQIQYLGFNLRDPILRDVRVRRAIAGAIDRDLLIRTLQRGHAQKAESMLPVGHWAYSDAVEHTRFDPGRSVQWLEEAGYKADGAGIRMHLVMKTSTDEGTRLLAAVLQQQLARIGIALEIRSYEPATFLADVRRGAFQLYSLRWIGGNEQPDIFSFAFASANFSPAGGNRSHYSNPQLDALLADAEQSPDQERRRVDYRAAQQILARDLPAFNLWYRDTIVVHNRRLAGIAVTPSGSFDFLESAYLRNN
jgi:peptide/nickel transport system substrate-binding protein